MREEERGRRRRMERGDGEGSRREEQRLNITTVFSAFHDVNDVTLRPHPLTREDGHFGPQGADDLIQSPFSVHHSIYTTM